MNLTSIYKDEHDDLNDLRIHDKISILRVSSSKTSKIFVLTVLIMLSFIVSLFKLVTSFFNRLCLCMQYKLLNICDLIVRRGVGNNN